MSSTGQQVWHLPEGVGLLWRSWDDEVVVYSVASQQTHLLDAFFAAVLRKIEAAPKTAEELGGRLGEALDTDRGELPARFDALLRTSGIRIETGPFAFRITSLLPELALPRSS